jgi:hypothetical protein
MQGRAGVAARDSAQATFLLTSVFPTLGLKHCLVTTGLGQGVRKAAFPH